MNGADHRSWQAVIGSSAILSLALLGDALIYAVLPVYAEDFGLTMPWVGVLLSANRFVRVFAYGVIARMATTIGVRRMCIAGAVLATVSTALYGFGQGPEVLIIARIMWGLAYAVLLLVTLFYSVEYRDQVGVRVGVGRAIQRLGPIAALFIGSWFVGLVGPNTAFIILAVPTALAIPIAFTLPERQSEKTQTNKPLSLTRPRPIDLLFFVQGYGVDGVFAVTITLIFAREVPLSVAVMSGGALLAMRHVGEAVAAPTFGWVADRIGARRVFAGSTVLTILGFVFVAAGLTVVGALIMLLFRGALASLGPAMIVQGMSEDEQAIGPLARMQAWRDLGAACGPLATGFLLAVASAELQHGILGFALALSFTYWLLYKP